MMYKQKLYVVVLHGIGVETSQKCVQAVFSTVRYLPAALVQYKKIYYHKAATKVYSLYLILLDKGMCATMCYEILFWDPGNNCRENYCIIKNITSVIDCFKTANNSVSWLFL